LPELKIKRPLLDLVAQEFHLSNQEAKAGLSFIFKVLQNVLNSEFETSLVYTVSSRTARATVRPWFCLLFTKAAKTFCFFIPEFRVAEEKKFKLIPWFGRKH
jgi:hypothetical protein